MLYLCHHLIIQTLNFPWIGTQQVPSSWIYTIWIYMLLQLFMENASLGTIFILKDVIILKYSVETSNIDAIHRL